MTKSKRGSAVRDLFGGRFLPPKTVLRSMRTLEKRLTAEFNERTRLKGKIAEHMSKYRAPLIEAISSNKGAANAVRGLRQIAANARGHKLQRPSHGEVKERVYTGSFGAVVTPPFDYRWTWSAVNGSPSDNSEVAKNNTGEMSIVMDTDLGGNSSSISGRVAVGIYFYPPAECASLLQVWSTPAFTDQWYDICAWDSCSADGWIGLYIESYDLTGAPTGAIIDQQVSLWSDSSWWSGDSGGGSNSGFGLYASPVQVDQDHQYIIWVWAGCDASADGWHTFSGSGAGNQLNIKVPSIRWELG
jgi:hypothetical protein